MKFKSFFLLFFIFGLGFFSKAQSDEVTKEKLVALGNVSKGSQLNGQIPVINWPINVEQENGMFTFSFPVMSSSGNNKTVSFNAGGNNTVVILNEKDTRVMMITADFYPAAEKEMAGFLFSIGVEQVMLQGKLISILDYINEFRKLVSKEIIENRIYVSSN